MSASARIASWVCRAALSTAPLSSSRGASEVCDILSPRSTRDPRDSRAVCSRFPPQRAVAGPGPPGAGCSLNPFAGNRRAERAPGLATSVASRPNRAARDSRAVCSRFPPRRAVAGPWPPGVGAVPLTLSAGNRRARSAWTCKVRRASTESRFPRFGRGACSRFPPPCTVAGPGPPAGRGGLLTGISRIAPSPRFLTRLRQENRIRFARRRFVLVLFPHGSTRQTHGSHAGHKNAAHSRF